MSGFSRRSPAVKRLMKEAEELREPTEQYYAQPLEDNLFEWHFTVRGPPDSDFHGGVYHGRITLPPEYPMKPPSIMLLTPTGRFEVGTKICLSISGYHPETWQPSWSIRTVMLAIIGFMPTKGEGAIGALDYTPEERKVLARKSQEWTCTCCNIANKSILPKVTSQAQSDETQKEAKELAAQITFKKETKKDKSDSSADQQQTPAASGPQQPPGPQNHGPIPPNPFAMFGNQGFPFHPSMFPQFPNNMMNPGQNPFNPSNQQASFQPPNQSATSTPDTSSDSTNQIQEPSSTSQSSTPSASGTNQSSESGLRQRRSAGESAVNSTTPRPSSSTSVPPSSSPSSGERPGAHQQQSNDTWVIIMIVLISLAIACLAIRRLYVLYEYKFDDTPIGQ